VDRAAPPSDDGSAMGGRLELARTDGRIVISVKDDRATVFADG
jgi:hypothetical protein